MFINETRDARQHAGWSADSTGAPVADETLIARARALLKPGEPLGNLFTRPSEEARAFLDGLSHRARAALENTAQTDKGGA